MASRKSGAVSARHIQNRRVMSSSSGFDSSASRDISRGSSAMPQMGHVPGPIWTTSGCIGHVYSASGRAGVAGVAAWSCPW